MRQSVFLLFFFAMSCASAAPNWDWSEPVRYKENHDPSMITLDDERTLQVSYAALSWENVDKWPGGKPLVLGYRAGEGVVLFDAESGKSLPVLHGLETRHPIDAIAASCLQKDETTTATIQCYVTAREHWEKEMERAYRVLLDSLDEPHRGPVRAAQAQWQRYRNAERAAGDAIYARDGTMWRIVNASQNTALVKERALRLADLYGGW